MSPNSNVFDMKVIENETRATAAKHVANMLQRPDQLEKVDIYKVREIRKKISVDGVLKTAMQTQLDGVRSGLYQLEAASKAIAETKKDMDEVPHLLLKLPEMLRTLRALKHESEEHSQCAAALENLEHILNIPKSVQEAIEYVNEGKLLIAHQSLAILESSRDDLLFEMHKLPNRSPTDMTILKHYFSEVQTLSEEISKQLWLILRRTLTSVRKEPKLTVNALRIIEREESADAAAIARHQKSGYMSIGRPKRWRTKAFQVLKQSVQERIEGNQIEDRSENKLWLVKHLEITRQIIVDDLRVVKNACVQCFPPKYQIFDSFVKMYHDCLSKHLEDFVDNELEDNEFTTLLTWLNAYGSDEMLGHPDLNIDVSKLPPLLKEETVTGLINQYITNVKKNYKDWMKNALATDVKDWHRTVGPDQNESGKYHTQLPLIIFNMLDQHLQVAQTVNDLLVQRMMLISIEEVKEFTQLYEESILEYKMVHFGNRQIATYYTHYTMATSNNCQQFCDLADKLRKKYCPDLFIISENAVNLFCETIKTFLRLMINVLKFLKDELFMDINAHLHNVMGREWFIGGNEIVDTVCATVEDYANDYTHLYSENFSLLLTDVMNALAISYIYAVMQKKMSFKSYEERKQVAEKVCAEGDTYQSMFNHNPFNKMDPDCYRKRSYYDGRINLASIAAQYGPPSYIKGSPFRAIPLLAEVLKLKDPGMLALEISGVIQQFPDISQEQMFYLIISRGDVAKSEAKQLVTDIMAGPRPKHEKTIFSQIPLVL